METEATVLTNESAAKEPLRYERNGDSVGIQNSHRAASIQDIWQQDKVDVHYGVDESPPFSLCVLLGFQHYISMFLATLTIPILLSPAICMTGDNVGKSELTGTLFVASGIITLMQTSFGCRLPIVQGGTFAIMVPTLSYLSLPQWQCPNNIVSRDSISNITYDNGNYSYITAGSEEHREIWKIRLREIQGSIMCAALFEVLLGATGLVGILLRFIGPLTICPTVTLLGLSLFMPAAKFASGQWWICLLTIMLMVIFSQYLGHFQLPCLGYSKELRCHVVRYPVFKMFPIILAVIITWMLCAILTAANVFPNNPDSWGYEARTDLRNDALYYSAWFRIPYPLQWGMPTASLSAVCAILSGVLATTIESVGDYHACAKLSGVPPPPLHAVNRGIMIEGLGSIIDGLLGTGNGTTSTSVNVGVVGLTKVGSRRVVQVSAGFMIVFGIFTKFGALFVTVPNPIIAGTFFILFGMIVAVGISNLQYVDMNSGRNLFIIGMSIFAGLAVPQWVSANKDTFNTGVQTIDNICQVLLSTSMFVGGMIGMFLDNTIPGTDKERGLAVWKEYRKQTADGTASVALTNSMSDCYSLPFGMKLIEKMSWTHYIPVCPNYGHQMEPPEEQELHDDMPLAASPHRLETV